MKTTTNLKMAFKAIIILFVLGSCKYYKTLEVSEHSQVALQTLGQYKNLVLVHDKSGVLQYQLSEMRIDNDYLSGRLNPFNATHPYHAKSINRKDAKKTNIDPLMVMHIYLKDGELTQGKFNTSLKNIESVEIHETATGKSTMVSASAFIGIAAVAFATVTGIAIALSECACPFVETYNNDTSQFHGSLFPGAIFKSLEREDYLELKDVVHQENGESNIRVFNNMPEIEYIDQLKLYEVNPENHANLVSTRNGFFTSYSNTHKPLKAVSGADAIVTQIVEADADVYTFDNLNQTDELNSLDVVFEKKNMSNHPKLTVVAQQSRWLEKVANFLFYNFGNKYNTWVASMDKSSSDKWNESNIKYGIALNVYLKSDGKWKSVGSFLNAGSLSMRNFILDLDLTNHKDSLVEIRFESAYKLWEIDEVAISDDYTENVPGKEIEMTSAINHLNQDVKGLVQEIDGEYLVQKAKGTYVELHFANSSNTGNTLFLKGVGYYHHSFENESKPNYSFLKNMKHDLSFHEMSKALEFSIAMHGIDPQ